MSAEEQLIENFYARFWLYLVAAAVFIVIVVLMLVFRNKILAPYNKSATSKIVLYSVVILLCLVAASFGVRFAAYAADLDAAANREYIVVTGTVVGYRKAADSENGETYYNEPIVEIRGTGEKIELDAFNTEINETYTFIYLKHSKLAVIKERL
jgi:hypothetical protein